MFLPSLSFALFLLSTFTFTAALVRVQTFTRLPRDSYGSINPSDLVTYIRTLDPVTVTSGKQTWSSYCQGLDLGVGTNVSGLPGQADYGTVMDFNTVEAASQWFGTPAAVAAGTVAFLQLKAATMETNYFIKDKKKSPKNSMSWVRHSVGYKFKSGTTADQIANLTAALDEMIKAVNDQPNAAKPLKVSYGLNSKPALPADFSLDFSLLADFKTPGDYMEWAANPLLQKPIGILRTFLDYRFAIQFVVNRVN